jgi:hypothetical protein
MPKRPDELKIEWDAFDEETRKAYPLSQYIRQREADERQREADERQREADERKKELLLLEQKSNERKKELLLLEQKSNDPSTKRMKVSELPADLASYAGIFQQNGNFTPHSPVKHFKNGKTDLGFYDRKDLYDSTVGVLQTRAEEKNFSGHIYLHKGYG